jgi:hypothetical protein
LQRVCLLFTDRWKEDYSEIAFPDLQTWADVQSAFVGGELASQATLGTIAGIATNGARWEGEIGEKPTAIKWNEGRKIGTQLRKQWGKLPDILKDHITKCRKKIVQVQGKVGKRAKANGPIICGGLVDGDPTTAYFFTEDLGVKEDCMKMVGQFKGSLRAFFLHLTSTDKVDKAQFAVCMSMIKEMGCDDAFAVQVNYETLGFFVTNLCLFVGVQRR